MKILLDFQNGMRAVTLNSEFSLCGLIITDDIKKLSVMLSSKNNSKPFLLLR